MLGISLLLTLAATVILTAVFGFAKTGGSSSRAQHSKGGGGIYGSKAALQTETATRQGTPAAVTPRTRKFSIAWNDNAGSLWLFGGYGRDSRGELGLLNDLWKWDGKGWRMISGSKLIERTGIYGAKGKADAANTPGARMHSETWIDDAGMLWLFGGWGRDYRGNIGRLNDLWKWDGAHWTWFSGSDEVNRFDPNGG